MRFQGLAAGLLALVFVVGGLTAVPAVGQTRDDYEPPRTPWGDPDLQGLWDTRTYTPVERPPEFGDREFMTAEEAAERERLGLRRIVSDDDDDLLAAELVEQDVQRYARSDRPDDGRPGFRIAGAEYNAFWSADPTSPQLSLRTSQIIEPRDGQMPPLTREALMTWERREAERRARTQADDWEDRGLSERCITRNGLPGEMLGSSQQPVKEIVQTPGYVTIVMPYGYVRIIPVNDPTPVGSDIRQWNGYSPRPVGGRLPGGRDRELQEHRRERRPGARRPVRRVRSRALLLGYRRDPAAHRALHPHRCGDAGVPLHGG